MFSAASWLTSSGAAIYLPVGNYSVKAELSGYLASFQAVNIQNENQLVTVVFELDDDDSLNSPPTAPVLLSPIDNAVNQPLTVQLTWNATDPDKGDTLVSDDTFGDTTYRKKCPCHTQ